MLGIVDGKSDIDGSKYWLCSCDCGKHLITRGACLRDRRPSEKGGTRSCGCLSRKLRPYEALYRRLKRDGPRFRDIAVDLSYEEFVEFTKQDKCHYCLGPIVWKDYLTNGHGYNLDRKDNDSYYTNSNVVVCCKRCNLGKRDTFTYEEWYGMTSYFRS